MNVVEVDEHAVTLFLDGICIETTAKRAHRRLVERLLNSTVVDPAVEEAVETLAVFLKSTNFRALRASDDDLAGTRQCCVRVERRPDGRVSWRKLP